MSKKSTKLEALHDLFEENYGHQSYVRHPLVSIVMIVFLRFWLMQMNGQKLKRLQKYYTILSL